MEGELKNTCCEIFIKQFHLQLHSAVAVGFVQLLASLLSGLLIDTVGRIPLLITSSVFMSLALASFGSYVHYDENSGGNGNSDWIPLLCVLIFTIAFSLGMHLKAAQKRDGTC